MSAFMIGDTVWYRAGADDRSFTVTGFFYDALSECYGVCLDGTSTHNPLRMAWLAEITKEPRL